MGIRLVWKIFIGLLAGYWIYLSMGMLLTLFVGPLFAVASILGSFGISQNLAIPIYVGILDLAVLSVLPGGVLKRADDALRAKNEKARRG
jgi:hypothetical protein